MRQNKPRRSRPKKGIVHVARAQGALPSHPLTPWVGAAPSGNKGCPYSQRTDHGMDAALQRAPFDMSMAEAPLPKSRGSAARSLEFTAPGPLPRVSPPGSSPVAGAIVQNPTLAASGPKPTCPKSRRNSRLGPPAETKSTLHTHQPPTPTEEAPQPRELGGAYAPTRTIDPG